MLEAVDIATYAKMMEIARKKGRRNDLPDIFSEILEGVTVNATAVGIPPLLLCTIMAEYINIFMLTVSKDANAAREGLKMLHQDQVTNLIDDWRRGDHS